MNRLYFLFVLLFSTTVFAAVQADTVIFLEKDGLVAVEGEHFYEQTKITKRQWYITSTTEAPGLKPDPDGNHASTASGKAYLEILPDTRRTHDDPLVTGESFSNTPGEIAIISYMIYFRNPGRYYVWVRAHSTGSEDNGCHVGLDDNWPSSGERMQWCDGKNSWYWESKQRTDANHCGEPYKIYLDVDEPGVHKISFSMREDGFEMDKFLLTDQKLYRPSGAGPDELVFTTIDTTAPGAPELQNIQTVGNRNLQLTWQHAKEPDGDISFYHIIRNNRFIAMVPGSQNTFIDSLLEYETEYTFQIAAQNEWGLIGEHSNALNAVTLQDEDPPNFLSANVHVNGQLFLSFDDILDPESITDLNNFDISGAAFAEQARLSVDQKSVIIDLGSASEGRTYKVIVRNLFDKNGNTMPEEQYLFFPFVNSIWVSMHTMEYLRSGAEIIDKEGSFSGMALVLPNSRSYAYDKITFPKSGRWYVWAHLFYEGEMGEPNSVKLTVGSSGTLPVGNNDNYMNVWHWDGDASKSFDKLQSIALDIPTSGEYSLRIRPNEPKDNPGASNIFIDGFYFTKSKDYRPRFSKVMTSVKSEQYKTPENYDFAVIAYPNPFNPIVSLQIQNVERAVDVTIFDMLGRKVFERKDYLQKKLQWNAEHMPSGAYIVRIQNSTETAFRKILLLK